MKSDLYRKLPSVDELLRNAEMQRLCDSEGQPVVTNAIRTVLSRLRAEIMTSGLDESAVDLSVCGLPAAIANKVRQTLGYSLRPVINATGVILHTNLGRAPLAQSALDHLRVTAATYSNLEFNLETGERGKRDAHVDRQFRQLMKSEVSERAAEISTIVVNNNAAAVLLALNTIAEAGEVIVSRGELVEIGGSFRIPDVMAKSQAILREIGTTNRTRIADYEKAITERTRLLLKVHRSNFQIVGFEEQPTLEE